jgi:hypothetical protein
MTSSAATVPLVKHASSLETDLNRLIAWLPKLDREPTAI